MMKKKSKTRRARETALQMLYAMEVHGDDFDGAALENFWSLHRGKPTERELAKELAFGTLEQLPDIDAVIERNSENFALNRLGMVERNVVRMAFYELKNRSAVPVAVIINEAVELAKDLAGEKSGAFVNGLIDFARDDEFFADRREEWNTRAQSIPRSDGSE